MENTQVTCERCNIIIEYYYTAEADIDGNNIHHQHIKIDNMLEGKTTQELINEFYW